MNNEKNNGRKGYFWQQWRKPKSTNEEDDKVGESPLLAIRHSQQKNVVAKVILNGYNIDQGMSLGSLGAMRSFKIIEGDLWDEWHEQTAVVLTDSIGQPTLVRIAALPTDDESFGLIEFISENN